MFFVLFRGFRLRRLSDQLRQLAVSVQAIRDDEELAAREHKEHKDLKRDLSHGIPQTGRMPSEGPLRPLFVFFVLFRGLRLGRQQTAASMTKNWPQENTKNTKN